MRAVLISNEDTEIVWANPTIHTLLNREPRTIVGQNLLNFLGEPADGELRRALDRAAEREEAVLHTTTYSGEGGEEITLRYRIEPILDYENGKLNYHITLGREVDKEEAEPCAVEKRRDAFREMYASSSLSLRQAQHLFERLDERIDECESYKDSEFSVADAARLVGTNDSYISAIVNFFTDLSFPNYMNYKRLGYLLKQATAHEEHARPAQPTAMWSEAGYGSYHAMYRYVKSMYGKTPGQLFKEVV